MSAHAVAAASGCCCAPAPTPCTCLEYGQASSGEDFEQLQVSGAVSLSYSGADCCGARLMGGALFGGATILRIPPGPFGGSGWNIQKQQVCPGLELGDVIGSATSTTGRCTYRAPCCNYTGCPAVERLVVESELPLWWCEDTYRLVPQDPCQGVVCACDEGGVPCGGNCPPAQFPEYPTADESAILIAVQNVWLTVCGIGGVPGNLVQAKSYLQIELAQISERTYRNCEPCGAGFNAVPLTYTMFYEKLCRFPGDTVRGTYVWSDALNGGPPSQVRSFSAACPDGIMPGGERKFTSTLVASPIMVIS